MVALGNISAQDKVTFLCLLFDLAICLEQLNLPIYDDIAIDAFPPDYGTGTHSTFNMSGVDFWTLPKYNFSTLESCLQAKSERENATNVIEIGYLAHEDIIMVPGAVELAVNNINKDPTLLPNVTLKFKFSLLDLYADNKETITRMTEMRDNGAVAFIGPDESCQHEALVSSAWNLPMLAFVSKVYIATVTTLYLLSKI